MIFWLLSFKIIIIHTIQTEMSFYEAVKAQNRSCFLWCVSLSWCGKRQQKGRGKRNKARIDTERRSLTKERRQTDIIYEWNKLTELHSSLLNPHHIFRRCFIWRRDCLSPTLFTLMRTQNRDKKWEQNELCDTYMHTDYWASLLHKKNFLNISTLFLLPAAVLSVSLTHQGVKTCWGLPGWLLLFQCST